MATHALRLTEDHLAAAGRYRPLSTLNRVLYILHGEITEDSTVQALEFLAPARARLDLV